MYSQYEWGFLTRSTFDLEFYAIELILKTITSRFNLFPRTCCIWEGGNLLKIGLATQKSTMCQAVIMEKIQMEVRYVKEGSSISQADFCSSIPHGLHGRHIHCPGSSPYPRATTWKIRWRVMSFFKAAGESHFNAYWLKKATFPGERGLLKFVVPWRMRLELFSSMYRRL